MSIKLELYRVFREVADRGSLSAAAKSLYISQSAVSQTIRQLEDGLGVRLFTRGTRGVTLTAEGQILYRYVSSAVSLLESGEEKLSQSRSLEIGQLTIAASDTITSSFLLPILDKFHRAYPGVRLHVLNGTSPEVVELLRDGKVDLCFANLPIRDEGLEARHCFEIHDVFVAAADYGCDFEETYTLQQVARMPLILLERKSNSRQQTDQYFLHHGIQLCPEVELGSYDMVLALARIGLGVACVIREFAQTLLQSGQLRQLRVSPPMPPRSIGALYQKNGALTPACRRFLEMTGCIQEEVKG